MEQQEPIRKMNEQGEIILWGAGGIGVVALEVLASTGKTVSYIVDSDTRKTEILGTPVYQDFLPTSETKTQKLLICVGDGETRQKLSTLTSFSPARAIDKSAMVSNSSKVGLGSMVFQRAIIQARSSIGKFTIINTAAQIDHDCIIGDFVHIAPSCVLCGFVSVGNGANLGANTTVIPGVSIGENVVTGAGAVVVNDIPDNCLAVGVPARVVKYKNG